MALHQTVEWHVRLENKLGQRGPKRIKVEEPLLDALAEAVRDAAAEAARSPGERDTTGLLAHLSDAQRVLSESPTMSSASPARSTVGALQAITDGIAEVEELGLTDSVASSFAALGERITRIRNPHAQPDFVFASRNAH